MINFLLGVVVGVVLLAVISAVWAHKKDGGFG